MPTLPHQVKCYIPDYCSAIYCCAKDDFTGLSFYTYLDINTCDYNVSGGIETLTFSFQLLDYEWGTFVFKSYCYKFIMKRH